MKVAVVLLALVSLSTAHLCLVGPHQRGTMKDVNVPAANDCGLDGKVAPLQCGGRAMAEPTAAFKAGVPVSIAYQKNLDHLNAASPGNFTVCVAPKDSSASGWKMLFSEPDSKTPSLHMYTPMITIPMEFKGSNAILQVRYFTNNANAPPVFYQCADIMVF